MTQTPLELAMNSPRLPTLPAVALQVLELSRDTNVDIKAVADAVRNDQALVTKVLRTVNSSFYGLVKPCATVRQALVYLGLNTVKSIVLGFSLVESMNGGDESTIGFNYVSYWRRALASAVAARELATRLRVDDPEEAFLTALMQDFGMVVMHRVHGDTYLQCIDLARSHGDLPDIEYEHLELTHHAVAAEMARRWNLPDHVCDAMHRHHDLEQSDATAFSRIVALACCIAEVLERAPDREALDRYHALAMKWFELEPSDADLVFETIRTSVGELSNLYDVETAEIPSIDVLLGEAEDRLVEHQCTQERVRVELESSNHELMSQALHDPLTGVKNRKFLEAEFNRLFVQSHDERSSFAMLCCDADHFTRINDTLGHAAGDEVLVQYAARLSDVVGDEGVVCRHGGEAFTVLCDGMSRAEAAELAERLRTAIGDTPMMITDEDHQTTDIHLTVSVGVAALEPELLPLITRPEMMYRVAEQAVLAAKSGGRNCVRVFRAKKKAA